MATPGLDEARRLVALQPVEHPGLWERAAVLLTRQEIEASLSRFWERSSPDLRRANIRAQLICLAEFMDGDVRTAGDVMQLWNALSRACHHDDYYLTPSATEVARWLDRAERLCDVIERHASA